MSRVQPDTARRIATLLLGLVLAGCGAGVLPAIHSEEERLAVARRLLDQGEYVAASELLKTYIANNAGSADVDQAIYLLGVAHLKAKDWVSAANEFQRLLRDYPESDSSAAARFALAESYFAQSRPPDFDQEYTLKALEEWQRYLQDFPGHWQNALARERILACRTRLADKLMRTGNLYLKLNQPKPARVYFEMVKTDYGDTIWVPEAELGLATCDVKEGRRAEAIARLQAIEARYPGQPVAARAARERKRLERS
ncbi:MAG: outer membrane protein assembly factor BamD [Candidatus Eiseniibacteriota bacterium]